MYFVHSLSAIKKKIQKTQPIAKRKTGVNYRLMTDRGMLRIEETVGEEVHRDGWVESKPS